MPLIKIYFYTSVNTAFDVASILNVGRSGSNTVTARLASMSLGSPPIWLTRKNNDFYVNGAKFIFRNMQACNIFYNSHTTYFVTQPVHQVMVSNQISSEFPNPLIYEASFHPTLPNVSGEISQ